MARRNGGPLVYTPAMATQLTITHRVVWSNPNNGQQKYEDFPNVADAKVFTQSLYRVGITATIETVA